MIEKKNAYFEEFKSIGRKYEEEKAKRKARKQEILDTLGWESEELKAWYEEDAAATYPIPQGACKAYRAWMNSIQYQEEEVEMADFLWEKEMPDFIDALKQAGITSFVYTNQSTAVMENLHGFVNAGCTMDGLCTIKRRDNRWGEEEVTEMIGVRFTIG